MDSLLDADDRDTLLDADYLDALADGDEAHAHRMTLREAISRLASDPGAPYTSAAAQSWRWLYGSDRSTYERLRAEAQSAGARVGEIDRMARWRQPRPDPIRDPAPDSPAGFVTITDGDHGVRPGVWHVGAGRDGDPVRTWICSPLAVEAVTSDGHGGAVGRLLRFRPTATSGAAGGWIEWAMPMELLASSDGSVLRAELLSMGVELSSSSTGRRLFAEYLSAAPPITHVRCTGTPGWCDGAYVMPDGSVIGRQDGQRLVLQTGERIARAGEDTCGTLSEWSAQIASPGARNPILALAISTALAAPLLLRAGAVGFGLHLVGDSTTGKSTVARAACSVWGGPDYIRSWRATTNGLEGIALQYCDRPLVLDEINEGDPASLGEAIYALLNGSGKQRAGRTGLARPRAQWRVTLISTGERSVETQIRAAGGKLKAGQALRLLDIPIARAHGVWDRIDGYGSGAALSEHITAACARHYGHAGRMYVARLAADPGDMAARRDELLRDRTFFSGDPQDQDRRAAAHFALSAIAGELGIAYGILPWPAGTAIAAAKEGARIWRAGQRDDSLIMGATRPSRETDQACEQFIDFVDRHGSARFAGRHATSPHVIRDQAGWYDDDDGDRVYLLHSSGMREAMKGLDFGRALDALEMAGMLSPRSASGARAQTQYLDGRPVRVYVVRPSAYRAR